MEKALRASVFSIEKDKYILHIGVLRNQKAEAITDSEAPELKRCHFRVLEGSRSCGCLFLAGSSRLESVRKG